MKNGCVDVQFRQTIALSGDGDMLVLLISGHTPSSKSSLSNFFTLSQGQSFQTLDTPKVEVAWHHHLAQ
jgi:hypothetical protein